MKKIILTGAGGFLGSHLLQKLQGMDVEVWAMTSQVNKLQEKYKGTNIHVIQNDEALEKHFDNVDVVINAAFPRNVDGIQMAKGLDFISAVATACAAGCVKGIINISSQSVYSQLRTKAADEMAEINLESKYAIGKYAAELIFQTTCADIPQTHIRLASLIGAGFDQRITNKFVKKAVAGEDLTLVGGQQQYGFLDVRDAAEAILRVILSDVSDWKSVYNVGIETSYTLEDIAKIVCEQSEAQTGKAITYSVKEETEEGPKQNSELNCQRFYSAFHWKPFYQLANTIQWLYEAEHER